jgi:hypothetical protein
MASAGAQARANALNARLENEAQTAIEEIERLHLRPVARKSHVCAVKCYDNAGSSGTMDALEMCVRKCQANHQQANQFVQNVSESDNKREREREERDDCSYAAHFDWVRNIIHRDTHKYSFHLLYGTGN